MSLWRLNQSTPVISYLAKINESRRSDLYEPIHPEYGTVERPRRLRLRSSRLSGHLDAKLLSSLTPDSGYFRIAGDTASQPESAAALIRVNGR